MLNEYQDGFRPLFSSLFRSEIGPSPEELVGELFFHSIDSDNPNFTLSNIRQGVPLFAPVGREVVTRGTIDLPGIGLVFRIPRSYQLDYLERPGSKYEEWSLAHLRGWALKQPVPDIYKSNIGAWLARMKDRSYVYENPIPVEDIRYLPPKFLIAGIRVKKVMLVDDDHYMPFGLSIISDVPTQAGITRKVLNKSIQLFLANPVAYIPGQV